MAHVSIVGDHPDAAPILWALRVLGASVSTTPCDALTRVVFGHVDEPGGAYRERVFVPNDLDAADLDLDQPGLWVVPTTEHATRLVERASNALRTLVLPWSHWEPIRVDPIVVDRVIARGERGQRVAVPIRCDVRVVNEHTEATMLIAPSSMTSLLVALHRGIPIVDFEDSPFAGCVIPGHNAILFSRSDADSIVERLLNRPQQLRRLRCPQPGQLRARQQRFLQLVHEHVLGHAPTRVQFFRRERRGQQRATGYRVNVIRQYGIQPTWDGSHEFVLLGGRIPVEDVQRIAQATDRPVVLAMNDAITEERLAWFQGVASWCKLMFVADPPALLPPVDCPVVQLHAPPSVAGPSGILQRPPEWPRLPPPTAPNLVFLVNHWYPRRVKLVAALARHVPVTVFGHCAPEIAGVRRRPFVPTADAMDVMRTARITLSASIRADREITSNRLFNAAAVGACILAEEFPNCRSLYPDSAVRWFSGRHDAIAGARELLSMDTTERRWIAQETTWRRHTSYDRMEFILDHVDKHLGIKTLRPLE